MPLYIVQPHDPVRVCECGKRFAMGTGLTGRRIPLSIDSELARRDESTGRLLAPSHFRDCPLAGKFSRRNRRP